MNYFDANTYYKERFGHKMYKASISLNVTCPNRDGSKGTGGCIFCSAGGSGEFATSSLMTVTEQINLAISRLSAKTTSGTGYIAYFQSFTSTYCDASYLKDAMEEAISHPRVEAVAIGTRPDCLPEPILNVLSDVASRIPLFVELGLQTIRDDVGEWFNRGYKTEEFNEAVIKLKKIGANVIAHVIFGLKGEDSKDMMNTVTHVVNCKCDGIKITSLYVLKNTKLAELYEQGEVKTFEMEEYFDLIEQALKIIPSDMVVHRITGDGPKSLLIAPMWTANKRAVVNYINKRFK